MEIRASSNRSSAGSSNSVAAGCGCYLPASPRQLYAQRVCSSVAPWYFIAFSSVPAEANVIHGTSAVFAVDVQRMSDRSTMGEADDDLARSSDFLDRHLSKIRQRIDRTTEAAHGPHVTQFEMVWPHSTVTGPAD